MLDWLNQIIYADVTWFNLIVALIIFFAALVVSKLLTIQLRRTFKEKIGKEHLENDGQAYFIRYPGYSFALDHAYYSLD